jgi:hypothetical protein
MAKTTKRSAEPADILTTLYQRNFLFQDFTPEQLGQHFSEADLIREKLYSSRPVYTAFRPDWSLDHLYAVLSGGPVIIRSTPLDRVIALTYSGSCFGMRNLDVGFGSVSRAFPSLVEAYKTTDVVKIPLENIQNLYQAEVPFRQRYSVLFELREKFQYHLLNCGAYPPQAVAALLRALVYQERTLGNQPQADGNYCFDLPIDIIARACQLNHRTVEQVLKGMVQVGLLKPVKSADTGDWVQVVDPEGLKEVYGATRDKVAWWPLR